MTKVKYAAIAAIVLLEAEALWLGINGALFGLVIAALAGLGGYELNSMQLR